MRINKNHGVIAILFGVGLFFLSILFATGSNPQLGVFGNIQRMEILLKEAENVCIRSEKPNSIVCAGSYEIEAVAIPIKYLLSLSVVIMLAGLGIILTQDHKS